MIPAFAKDRCRAVAALSLFALLLVGCHSRSTGSALVLATCLGRCDLFDRVTVTVHPGDGGTFTPLVADLTARGVQWSARIDGIPAGPGRAFDAVAYDRAGSILSAASGKVDIRPRGLSVVAFALGGPAENSVPVIDSLSADAYLAAPLSTVRLSSAAHSPDPANTLTYSWLATCGSFDRPDTAGPAWVAPAAPGVCRLTLTVADNRGSSTSASLFLVVASQVGSASVTAEVNLAPVIETLTAAARLSSTLEAELQVAASDPDRDPLTYLWSSDCAGARFDFTPPHGYLAPHLSVPAPSRPCNVVVTVSDPPERGGTTRGVLVLPPNPGFGNCGSKTCPVVPLPARAFGPDLPQSLARLGGDASVATAASPSLGLFASCGRAPAAGEAGDVALFGADGERLWASPAGAPGCDAIAIDPAGAVVVVVASSLEQGTRPGALLQLDARSGEIIARANLVGVARVTSLWAGPAGDLFAAGELAQAGITEVLSGGAGGSFAAKFEQAAGRFDRAYLVPVDRSGSSTSSPASQPRQPSQQARPVLP